MLAELDLDSFRLRGHLVPLPTGRTVTGSFWSTGSASTPSSTDCLAGPCPPARQDVTNAGTDRNLTHARFVSAPTALAPGERVDLLHVAASGERALIATVRLPLG